MGALALGAGLLGSLFGGHGSKTDRKFELGAFGQLQDLMFNAKDKGNSEFTAGQGGLDSAMKYFQSLLSGDRSTIEGAIAPQVSALTGQAQQQKETESQFGNRSGGTNAANQMTTERISGEISNLINSLIPGAAQELGALGTTREGIGLQALGLDESAAANLAALAGHSKTSAQGVEAGLGQNIGQYLSLLFNG